MTPRAENGIAWRAGAWVLALLLVGACNPTGPTVEDTVLGMFEASRNGRVEDYLRYFAGDMRAVLDKTADEMGRDAFRDYLLKTNEPIVGIAVSDREDVADGHVQLRVELVYRNKNEVQYVTLMSLGTDWKIREMSRAKRIKTLVPYGQQVFDLPADTTTPGGAPAGAPPSGR